MYQKPETVTVSTKNLQQLLQALSGPDHLIREIQYTRGLGANPLDDLITEFNKQISTENPDNNRSKTDTECKICIGKGHIFEDVYDHHGNPAGTSIKECVNCRPKGSEQ